MDQGAGVQDLEGRTRPDEGVRVRRPRAVRRGSPGGRRRPGTACRRRPTGAPRRARAASGPNGASRAACSSRNWSRACCHHPPHPVAEGVPVGGRSRNEGSAPPPLTHDCPAGPRLRTGLPLARRGPAAPAASASSSARGTARSPSSSSLPATRAAPTSSGRPSASSSPTSRRSSRSRTGPGARRATRTVAITGRIARETSMRPMGHLTGVGSHPGGARRRSSGVVPRRRGAQRAGVARRPAGGPRQPWTPTPGGLSYASELVALAGRDRRVQHRRRCLPRGAPAAASLGPRRQVLLAKARRRRRVRDRRDVLPVRGLRRALDRDRARSASEIPVLPGIMPITNLRQVTRMAELSGSACRPTSSAWLDGLEGDPAEVRRNGIAMATELCERAARRRRSPACTSTPSTALRATLEIFEAPAHHGLTR